MLNRKIVEEVDRHLDEGVSEPYKQQPLAQDWARVAKLQEEAGEAIAELILATGQNPRKGLDETAKERLLKELADAAMTGVYAIQHFTKDINVTEKILLAAQEKHLYRLAAQEQKDNK